MELLTAIIDQAHLMYKIYSTKTFPWFQGELIKLYAISNLKRLCFISAKPSYAQLIFYDIGSSLDI